MLYLKFKLYNLYIRFVNKNMRYLLYFMFKKVRYSNKISHATSRESYMHMRRLKNVCQPSCFALLLFTSYLGNSSYNKKYARKIFLYCIFIKMCSNEQVYPYDGRDFLWIQNENLNFSTTKMAAVLISTRNA